LEDALAPALGAGVGVEGLRRLSGGASRETWQFDAVTADGIRHELVLRRDPPGRPSAPGGMALEARALRAAHCAGLPVPVVLVDDASGASFGSAGMVMERIAGESIARRILRDDEYALGRAVMTGQCGEFLARLHSIPPREVPGLHEEDALTALRLWYDQMVAALDDTPSATFELAFRWLDTRRPVRDRVTVVHGDFRLGNFIVGTDGLRAVLDWELVHLGDPLEDLGWLCTKAWRFGAEPAVGGFGTIDELVRAYEATGGGPVDRAALHWWLVFGTLRWGVICMGQAVAHLLGAVRSVELAAIGRRVCEQEWDLLHELSEIEAFGAHIARQTPQFRGLHGRPTAVELLGAVREFLEGDVAEATEGRVRFHARVAANVVGMVTREIELGAEQTASYAEGLAGLGVSSEAELAAKVARAELDDRQDELIGFLLRTVGDKLAVANPKLLRP
jgi:aminoglycoside phosphotransferase (APT) family kinase protein